MDGKASQRKMESFLKVSEVHRVELQHLLLKVEKMLAVVDTVRRRQARSMVRRKLK